MKAVVVAFRAALRSFEVRNDVENPVPGGNRSWSAVINCSEAKALKAIDMFCSDKASYLVPPQALPSLTGSRNRRAPRDHT